MTDERYDIEPLDQQAPAEIGKPEKDTASQDPIRLNANDVIALWSVQESLLQTYRSIFIGAQSLLVPIAFLMLPQKVEPVTLVGISPAAVLSGLGMLLLWSWRSVSNARAQDVTWVQGVALEVEADTYRGGALFSTFKHYQENRERNPEQAYLPARFEELQTSATRRVMEYRLFYAFVVVWLVYLGVALFSFSAPDRLASIFPVWPCSAP